MVAELTLIQSDYDAFSNVVSSDSDGGLTIKDLNEAIDMLNSGKTIDDVIKQGLDNAKKKEIVKQFQ